MERDSLTGGAGADTFNAFGGAGLDLVIDFNAAEGDRVRVDDDVEYTVSQADAGVVMTSGSAVSWFCRA